MRNFDTKQAHEPMNSLGNATYAMSKLITRDISKIQRGNKRSAKNLILKQAHERMTGLAN